jgi:hypothetical protein
VKYDRQSKSSLQESSSGCSCEHRQVQSTEFDACLHEQELNDSRHLQALIRARWVSRNGCHRTIEQVLKMESVGFTYLQSNNLRIDDGESSLSLLEYDITAATDSAGSTSVRWNGFWAPGLRWKYFDTSTSWDSIMVESVRRVLQRWRGVCSFSLTMRGTWSGDDDVSELRPKKQCRPISPTSVRRGE